jgi:UDP-N-acetylglucosamine--N-acetylmuramyl-(pentapeptide) pyrophosphoryl-undecaprenol N-acetylglucosamine transferase
MKSAPKKKILVAVGGTGGHVFPAMGLAEELLDANKDLHIVFAGAGLSTNRYFDRDRFVYCDVESATPARGGIVGAIRSLRALSRGLIASLKLLSKEKPHLVVGFGSFHAFPLLCAAALKRIPLVLFESNALPGRVIRLFSKRAHFTGIYFSEAQQHLRGKTVEVHIPQRKSVQTSTLLNREAKVQLGLDEHSPTLLVFGGSQGARAINAAVSEMLQGEFPFQLIHFTGSEEIASDIRQLCAERGIRCYVKPFEPRMAVVWKAADMALCRAGAMTLSELIEHEVPCLLIPYRFASENHQMRNALFMQNKVKGGFVLEERNLSGSRLLEEILHLDLSVLSSGISYFKKKQSKHSFSQCVIELLNDEQK